MGQRSSLRLAAAAALIAVGALAVGVANARRPGPAATREPAILPTTRFEIGGNDAIQPVPLPAPADVRKIALGRRLFSEPALSVDHSIACVSCHQLDKGGADGRKVAVGVGGATGAVNTPTVFNADLNPKQFWDGRADTLEAQIDGPLTNPAEMASSWPKALGALQNDSSYVRQFADAYPQGLTSVSVKDALASFERTLVTRDSPFDRFLAGDKRALTEEQVRGYALFRSYGCVRRPTRITGSLMEIAPGFRVLISHHGRGGTDSVEV